MVMTNLEDASATLQLRILDLNVKLVGMIT